MPPAKVCWGSVSGKVVAIDIEFNSQRAATEIAVKSAEGSLLDTLVKPIRTLGVANKMYKAFDTGHLKASEFTGAPEFKEVQQQLEASLKDKIIIGYNVCGDINILNDNRAALGLPPLETPCVIDLIRVFRGMRDRKLWQNHSLTEVLRAEGVAIRPGVAHRAGWDAEATLDLAKHYINMLGMQITAQYGAVPYEYRPITKRPTEDNMSELQYKAETPKTIAEIGALIYQGKKDITPRLRHFSVLSLGKLVYKGKSYPAAEVIDRDEKETVIKHVMLKRFQDKWGKSNAKEVETAFLKYFSK